MATAIQTFTATGTWTAPAGVTTVVVTPTYAPFDQYAGLVAFAFNATNGSVYGFGQNAAGAFGNGIGTLVDSTSPIVIAQGLKTYKVFSGVNTVASFFYIGKDGITYAAGSNLEGSLGIGDTTPRSVPTAVLGGLSFKEIISENDQGVPNRTTTFGLTTNGDLFAWGNNAIGQLGDGTTVSKSSPVRVLGGLKFKKVQIAVAPSNIAGVQTSCFGLTTTGQIYAWGGNVDGQLGTGDTTNRTSPALVIGGQTWTDFSAIGTGSQVAVLALNSSGVAYSWGVDISGIRGDGGAVFKTSSPGLVSGGHTFVKLVAVGKGSSAYGLKSNGEVWSWGQNINGQLGLNDTTFRNVPNQIIGGLTATNVFSDGLGSAFITTQSNQLYALGRNIYGNLGVGDVTPRSSPALVLGGFSWKKMIGGVGGNGFPKAVTNGGAIYFWGAFYSSVTDTRSSPVIMPGGLTLKEDAESFGPMPSRTQITVVPGTSYAVTISDKISTFGKVSVSSGAISSLTIEYDQ